MKQPSELEMIRANRIDSVNIPLRDKGYLIKESRRNGMKYLDLYRTTGECEKALFAGSYKEMDLYLSGMYNALMLVGL